MAVGAQCPANTLQNSTARRSTRGRSGFRCASFRSPLVPKAKPERMKSERKCQRCFWAQFYSVLGCSVMEWDTYSQHGNGWSLWIERVSGSCWEAWYQSRCDGNRFLARANTRKSCVALLTPECFAPAGIEPPSEVFSAARTSWIRSLHLGPL